MSQIHKQASIATLAVSGSRVMGLAREMVFAYLFGASPALDAFIAAFRIPNLLRDLFAEGALSTSFVTVFSQETAKGGDEKGWKLANQVFTAVFIIIGLVTVLGIFFSDSVVSFVASGFTGDKHRFTVFLNQILFPFILLVSLAAVAMGMLNTKGKFALPQSASTFFNITSVACGLLFAWILSPHFFGGGQSTWEVVTRAMTGMAIGTLIGGFVQWAVQMPSLIKMGYRPRPALGWGNPAFIKVMKLTGPAIIGGAAVQVNVLVNTNFASYLADGSISWLNYAFRLMQLPLGLFGVAVALASAPALARLLAQNEHEQFKKTLRESSQMALFLCIPSALGLIALADPIISLIYQYGQFTAHDTHQAANALRAYAVGLSFYALIKIYQPAFLAHGDAKTPMAISLLSIAINFTANWLFVFKFGFAHWGLALGTSCVALWDFLWLAFLMRKKSTDICNGQAVKEVAKIVLSAALSVLAGWVVYRQISGIMGNDNLWQRLLLVFPPIAITLLFYYFFCSRMGVEEIVLFRNWMRKGSSLISGN